MIILKKIDMMNKYSLNEIISMSLDLALLQKLMAIVMPTIVGKDKYTYLLRKVIDIIEKCANVYPDVKYTCVTRVGQSIYDTACRIEFDQIPYTLSITTESEFIGNDFCDSALKSHETQGLISNSKLGYNKYDTNRYHDENLFEKHMMKVFKKISEKDYNHDQKEDTNYDDEEPSLEPKLDEQIKDINQEVTDTNLDKLSEEEWPTLKK